ncbi:hypothetical protein [Parafilimonas sp.]|uniref:hypothetical protein n=1 Tax=Parafilimonas sp. TaxID=1969739 RepID=UPI0039E44D55
MPFIKSFSIDADKKSPFPYNILAVKYARHVSLRIGKGSPLSNKSGKPMAMASDTMPRMPDQLMRMLVRVSNNASSLIFRFRLPWKAFAREEN